MHTRDEACFRLLAGIVLPYCSCENKWLCRWRPEWYSNGFRRSLILSDTLPSRNYSDALIKSMKKSNCPLRIQPYISGCQFNISTRASGHTVNVRCICFRVWILSANIWLLPFQVHEDSSLSQPRVDKATKTLKHNLTLWWCVWENLVVEVVLEWLHISKF